MAASAHAAHQRDFLVGPVTLGHGDSLVVTAANVEAAPKCLEPARVEFVEHAIGDPPPGSMDSAEIAVVDIVRTELGAARLAPGKSAKVRVRGGHRLGTKTVQVRVETVQPALGIEPCINVGGTVIRSSGKAEAVSGVQFADDFSVLRPSSEATCIGFDDCDHLLELCEQTAGCSFSCRIAIPHNGQACAWGSTDWRGFRTSRRA
jgi:hypothetical protein